MYVQKYFVCTVKGHLSQMSWFPSTWLWDLFCVLLAYISALQFPLSLWTMEWCVCGKLWGCQPCQWKQAGFTHLLLTLWGRSDWSPEQNISPNPVFPHYHLKFKADILAWFQWGHYNCNICFIIIYLKPCSWCLLLFCPLFLNNSPFFPTLHCATLYSNLANLVFCGLLCLLQVGSCDR